MECSSSVDDRQFHENAQEVGYSSSNCDACGATGRAEPRVDPGSSSGSAKGEICQECNGSGRWWFPELRGIGSLAIHLTDAELRILLRSRTKGRVQHG